MTTTTPYGPEFMFTLFYVVYDEAELLKAARAKCIEMGLARNEDSANALISDNHAAAGSILLKPIVMPGCVILHSNCL